MDAVTRLESRLAELAPVVVAYSGGVDSAFLAEVAHQTLGAGAFAVTAVSPSLAPRERVAARTLAERRGWRHEEVRTDEATRAGYVANDTDRCYFCKDALFDVLDALARQRDGTVCVGTNLDDLGSHRPGLRAVAEHAVAQPLVDAGFTKSMVRDAARRAGLPVADKPATPCLASRVAYGISVTPERLARIADAEALVWERGVGDVRVRDLGDSARIEVPPADRARLDDELLEAIVALGFQEAAIAPDGLRSGGMLELLPPDARSRANVE